MSYLEEDLEKIKSEHMDQAAEKLYPDSKDCFDKRTRCYVKYRGKYLTARKLVRTALEFALSRTIYKDEAEGTGGEWAANFIRDNFPDFHVIDKNENDEICEIDAETSTAELKGREKEVLVKHRLNQGEFRDQLLKRYDEKCCLCNMNMKELLVASHIKPWSVSKKTEKLDSNNGFLMCPNHDKLFDQGWITFDDSGKICISKKIGSDNRNRLLVQEDMKLKLTNGNKKYLEYHRKYIFKDNAKA